MEEAIDSPIKSLTGTLPQVGELVWIGLRPEQRAPLTSVQTVKVTVESGLEGDHFSSKKSTKRQVTLIQQEHLDAVAGMLGKESVPPTLTRRNLVVKGINLLALKDKRFKVGDVLLEFTGYCYPCSRMEENLGPGGYNAMRGHGGILTRVIEGGEITIGDQVVALAD